MPTFDQLPAEQRAIIELVVQRGRSYDDLADALGITSARVRDLARDALVELAPVTAARVDSERRAQLADYVLGQQSSAEQTATRAHLRRSEPSRAWALSLADSLDGMYGDGLAPDVPAGDDRGGRRPDALAGRERDRVRERDRDRPRDRVRRDEPVRRGDLSPEARVAVRNRRVAAAIGGLLIVGALTVGIVAIAGGDDEKKESKPAAAQPRVVGQLLLNATKDGSKDQGIALIADRGKERDLIVQARLTPTKRGQAYEVWLYNSPKDAVSLGAQVTDQQGAYQGAGALPAPLERYRYIDVSLEKIDRNAAHSGNSVLRGAIADMRAPAQEPQAPGGATGPSGATGSGTP
ncbi:MAG TPA: anti-sigma factor [Thermoleophilaceae bacterium]